MLDQDENNFAWGEGGLECADLNVTHYRVFHSECLNSFLQLLVSMVVAYNSPLPLKGTVIRFSKGINGKQKDGV